MIGRDLHSIERPSLGLRCFCHENLMQQYGVVLLRLEASHTKTLIAIAIIIITIIRIADKSIN